MGGWNINGPVATVSVAKSSSKKKPEVERFVKKVKTRDQLFEEYRLNDYGKADAAWDDEHIKSGQTALPQSQWQRLLVYRRQSM